MIYDMALEVSVFRSSKNFDGPTKTVNFGNILCDQSLEADG